MFSGAKGGSSTFKQTPDNLRSNDTFEGVLGLCIGPIKGPVRGLKSVKVDGTAVENATGQQNFQDFTVTLGDGDPLKFPQKVQLKLGAGAAPTQVGVSLPNTNGVAVWQTKTLTNRNADFIDMRFIVNQLTRQDAKGIYPTTATLEIQMKPVGATTWVNPAIGTATAKYAEQGNALTGVGGSSVKLYTPRDQYDASGTPYAGAQNYVINGKTTGAAVYELRIGVPNTGTYADTAWDIRVRLLERDSYTGGKDGVDQEKRSITWESIAAVYGNTMGEHEDWRGLAWIQTYGKASDQLTGVPEITGEYDTKIMSVPTSAIYNPDTRQYMAGIWDGSWTKAYTNDPAWVINDAISDELSGISLIAQGSYLNKWDALDLSKFCSELVPDGNGGTEPRYTMNIAVSQPQKAEELIRYLAGAVGALAWDQGDGEWRVKVDKADAPSDIFTLDNIEGEFLYSHTDVDTRFNDIIGQFKNAEMDYAMDAVRLYDNPSIAKIGRKPTTIVLVGCTSRQEALRRVKLRLRSTVNENRNVTFTTNRRGRNIEQLSTILIADGDLGDREKRTHGRTISVAADRKSITVRDPLYVAPGVDYKLWFTIPNPNYSPSTATQPTSADWTKPTVAISRPVANTSAQRGTVTTIYFTEALPASIAENLSIALEAASLPTMPRLFRVTNVAIGDDGERLTISGINIDTGKWAAADGVSKEDTVFTDLRGAVTPPTAVPGNPVLSLIRVPLEQGSTVNLQATWVRPSGAFNSGFRIQYSVNGGALQTAVERQQLAEWELVNAGPGLYHVEICTIDRRGGFSQPLIGELEVTQSLIDATQVKYNSGETLEEMKPAAPGADVTGDNPALDVKNVGGRPVQDVVAIIDGTKAIADKSVIDIERLSQSIGDTGGDLSEQVNAANAARDAARAARDESVAARNLAQAAVVTAGDYAGQALASKNLSEAAKTAAETARGQAQTAVTASQTAKTAAETAAAAAAVSKSDASGFATTASGKADIATQKADAAGQSATLAKASLDKAETARSGAESARDLAVTAKNSAEGASSSAAGSASLAAQAKTDAGNAASASLGSAQTAAASADTAGQKASASDVSRQKAETAQGLAEVSKTAAALSESNALGSEQRAASSASVSASLADTAGRALAAQFPRTMVATAFMIDPAANVLTSQSYIAPAAVVNGKVVMDTTSSATYAYGLWTRGYLPYEAGKTYELRARAEWISGAPDVPAIVSYFHIYNAAGGIIGESTWGATTTLVANTPVDLVQRLTLAVNVNAKFIRFGILVNRKPTNLGLLTVGRTDVHSLYPVDVTDSVTAQGFATAASTSADAAGVSKTAAGTSASAANTSRQEASTFAGQALSYRNTASDSATAAGVSENKATLASGVSARAALDGSANAANDNRSPGAAMSLWSYNDYNIMNPTPRLTNDPAIFTSVNGMLRTAPGGVHVHPVAPTRVQPSKRYRAYARFRLLEDGAQPNGHYLYISCFDANGSLLAGNVIGLTAVQTVTVAQGYIDLSQDFSTDGKEGSTALPTGTAFVRVMYRTSGLREEIALLYIEDVEGQVAAGKAAIAASGSSASAKASQDIATQKAEAADGYRSQAQTAQGLADASRAAAAVSESNAGGSANTATTQANLASKSSTAALTSAISTVPSGFNQGSDYWAMSWSGADNREPGFTSNFTFDTAKSVVFIVGRDIAGQLNIAHRGSMSLAAGRRRRLTARWQVFYASERPAVYGSMFFIGIPPAGGPPSVAPGREIVISSGQPGWGAPNGYTTHTFDIEDNDLIAAGMTSVRGLLRLNTPVGTEQFFVSDFKLEDVTSENASKKFAEASSVSASTASSKADAAGQSASAADLSRIDAQTARGQAQVARDAAVTAKDTAAGSASTAATSAALSARAAQDAAGAAANDNRSPGAAMSLWGYDQYNTFAPTTRLTDNPGAFSSVANTLRIAAVSLHTHPLTPTRLEPGRRYRAYARYRITTDGAQPAGHQLYVAFFDINGAILTGNVVLAATGPNSTVSGGWQEMSRIISDKPGDMWVSGAAYARVMYRSSGTPTELPLLYLEDIEGKAAAGDFASAANTSASSASASKDAAGQSASAANQSRIDAQAANGTAQSAASSANTAAVNASADASRAQTSATIATSYSSTATTLNDKFANWADPAAIPSGWVLWASESNFRFSRIAGSGSAYAVYMQCDGSNYQSGFRQVFRAFAGPWVMEATVRLDANVWNGAGIHCDEASANIHFGTEPDTLGRVGGNILGTRTWSKMFNLAREADLNFYMMHGWTGFGEVAPKYLTWYMARLRPATQQEVNANKALADSATNAARINTVNDTLSNDIGSVGRRVDSVEARAGTLEASTGVIQTAVTNLKNGQAAARIELTAVTPGGRAAITLRSDNNGGAGVDIVGDVNFMGNLKIQKNIGGRTITIDSDTGITFNNGIVMKVSGVGFGSANQFIEWVGPSLGSLSQCTEANAIQYVKTDGSAYFGGSLTAGTLRNAAASSGLGTNETAVVGPFGSNGKPVRYIASWSYTTVTNAYYAPTQQGLNQYNAAAAGYPASGGGHEGSKTEAKPNSSVTLNRAFAGAGYQQLDSRGFTTLTTSFRGAPPQVGDQASGYAVITTTIGGGFTVNDPVQSAQDRTLQLSLVRGFTGFGDTVAQRLSIVAIEE
jgi:predicted phage tail protein